MPTTFSDSSHPGRWNAGAQAAAGLGQLAVTLVLVRVLDPGAYAAVAIVYLVAGVQLALEEGSLSTPLVSVGERDSRVLAGLLVQEYALGAVLATGLYFLAPAIAAVYEIAALVPLLRVLAPLYVLGASKRFYQSVFQRDLAFRRVGYVRAASATVFAGVTTGLALLGYGTWALVIGLLARSIVESVGYAAVGRAHVRLGSVRSVIFDRGYARAGWTKAAERGVSYAAERLDVIVIGWALGPVSLGGYDACKRLLVGAHQQVSSTVSRVAVGRLAVVGPARGALGAAFGEALAQHVWILVPTYVAAAVFAEPLATLALGQGWEEYSSVLRWVAIALLARCLTGPVNALFMARAAAGREVAYAAATAASMGSALFVATVAQLDVQGFSACVAVGVALPGWLCWVYGARPVLGQRGVWTRYALPSVLAASGSAALAWALAKACPTLGGATFAMIFGVGGVALARWRWVGRSRAPAARVPRR